MNFYYHPILGLRYTYIDNSFYIVDINAIPTDLRFSVEKYLYYLKKMKVAITNSSSSVVELPQITEYMI